jgi:hypothetical protein
MRRKKLNERPSLCRVPCRLAAGLADCEKLSTSVELHEKRFALLLQAFFQSFGAVTVATSPRFGAIFMPAVFAIMGVPDTQQFKKMFPIRPLFGEGRGAKTGLNPMSNTVRTNAGTLEVVNVFVPGNRAASQRTISDGFQ